MTTIWRYMDLWKFESILAKKALFFSKVSAQTDGLEGMYPLIAKIFHARQLGHLPQPHQSYALHNQEVFTLAAKDEIILSCWHINDSENPRMWNDYIEADNGIAIQTTEESLKKSLEAFSHPCLINIDKVQYVNRTTFSESLLNDRMSLFFQKDKNYSWEKELRCAIDVTLSPLSDDQGGEWNAKYLPPKGNASPVGYFIPIEVNTLIEKIVVSPKASCLFNLRVKALCRKYGLVKPIENSGLYP